MQQPGSVSLGAGGPGAAVAGALRQVRRCSLERGINSMGNRNWRNLDDWFHLRFDPHCMYVQCCINNTCLVPGASIGTFQIFETQAASSVKLTHYSLRISQSPCSLYSRNVSCLKQHSTLIGDMSDENGFTPKKERPDDEDCGGCGGRFYGTRHFDIKTLF